MRVIGCRWTPPAQVQHIWRSDTDSFNMWALASDNSGHADHIRDKGFVHRKPDENSTNRLHISMWDGERFKRQVFCPHWLTCVWQWLHQLSLFKFKVHDAIQGRQTSRPTGRENNPLWDILDQDNGNSPQDICSLVDRRSSYNLQSLIANSTFSPALIIENRMKLSQSLLTVQ